MRDLWRLNVSYMILELACCRRWTEYSSMLDMV